MKKSLNFFLLIFVISLFTNNLFAQGAYINLNTGYGLNMNAYGISGSAYIDRSNSAYTISSTTYYEYKHFEMSLGKGLNFGGAFGYMFHKNIGVELGLSYHLGSKSTDIANVAYYHESVSTLSSQMLRIIPSVVMAAGFKKVNPYIKLGLLIGSGFIIHEIKDNAWGSQLPFFNRIILKTMKLNGGIALGVSSGIGTTFNLSDKISFYGEFNMVNLSYTPTTGEVVKYTRDGEDRLPNLSTAYKNKKYVDMDTYIENKNTSTGSSQPEQELKVKFPYSSIGVNIGLRINFLRMPKGKPQ